jgi:hypothetical protein
MESKIIKFGAIIRSIEERTEGLCYDAVSQHLKKNDIHVIRNVYPFSNVVKQMMLLASVHSYDWYIGVDADIVLCNNWFNMINGFLYLNDIDSYYKIDFQLQDRFVNNTHIYGVHLYNGKYALDMLNALEKTKDTSKPEGNIRHRINAKFMNSTYGRIGYHGYEQYYRDIYRRFAIRSFRNKEDVKRYNLFKVHDDDNFVGFMGWHYGVQKGESVLKLLNAKNSKLASEFGYKEKSELTKSLGEFYEDRGKEDKSF